MPQARIEINAVAGSDDDLPINVLVQLSNADVGGETSYSWTIADKPPGSIAALSNPLIENPTFTPDVEGSYLLRLVVNGSASYTDTAIAAVRSLKTRERVPAAGETDEVDTADGWAGTTGASSYLRRLDAALSDFGTIVAYAASGLLRGQLVALAEVHTLKAGLPGEEMIPTVDSVGSALGAGEVLLVVEGDTSGGTSVIGGQLARCRAVGLFGPVTLGAVSLGEPVYWAADALSLTPAVIPGGAYRMVGRVVRIDGTDNWVWFNGLQFELEPTRLSEQLLDSAADVSDVGAIRVRSSGGKFQVSEAGAAYVDVVPSGGTAPANAPYLTDGSVAGLSAERNIQSIATTLVFKANGAAVVPVALRRFSAGAAADLLQVQDELGASLLLVSNIGDVTLTSSATQSIFKTGAALDFGTANNYNVTFWRNGAQCWQLVSGGHLQAVGAYRNVSNVAEPAAANDAVSAQVYGTLSAADALAHVLATHTLTDGTSVRVKVGVVCSNATHTKVDVWTVEIAAYRSGGGAVIAGSLITGPTGNLGAGTVTVTASGNDVEITVTGDGTALLWKAVGEVITT